MEQAVVSLGVNLVAAGLLTGSAMGRQKVREIDLGVNKYINLKHQLLYSSKTSLLTTNILC